MTVAVLSTGTELTRGELVNTNASWLADALTELGFNVTELATVGDDRDALRATLLRLGAAHDVIVCTGGLGPTTDDLTTTVVAELLGVGLVRDPASLDTIRRMLERVGRQMAASNEKQADFPEGAAILPNLRGTAPGFSVTLGRAAAFFLPGVPSEMRAMFEGAVVPHLETLSRTPTFQVRLKTFGLPESEINDRLQGIETATGIVLGYRASLPEIEVKVLATGDQARERATSAAAEVRARLGDAVYGEGATTFPEAVLGLLEKRGATVALAESCTGGLVAELLTSVPGASKTFLGGVVSYANSAKVALLGVRPDLLQTHGAVSPEVARAMAQGARERFGATVALAITGIAGPDGGTPEKPVGLVHFAVAGPTGVTDKKAQYRGSRTDIQRRAAYTGLALVRKAAGTDSL
jgi:nicotinamide-nucleotide amidase